MRVLVVEDEAALAEGVRRGLEAEGFATDVARNGVDGLWMATEHPYDAIVLDILLPGMNGYKVCAELRAAGVWTPILMLTAKDGELDEAEALDTGADDYVTKPFSYVALVARLRALIRRGAQERPAVLEAGDLRLDPAERRAWRGDVELSLTARELSLLEFLLRRRRRRSVRRPTSSTTCGTTSFDGDLEHRRGLRRAPARARSTGPSDARRSRPSVAPGYRLAADGG